MNKKFQKKGKNLPFGELGGAMEPIIHVGILSGTSICFVLNGEFECSNKEKYLGNQVIRFDNGKIFFDENRYSELSFFSTNNTSFDLIDVVIGVQFHWERKENLRFKGDLRFIVEGDKLTAINDIAVEDYLASVISSEMRATASDELLKAHAVISRSWLLHPILSPVNESFPTETRTKNKLIKWYERDTHANFDVCADDHCQRYQGITRQTTEQVNKAVEATRGQVLMYDGKICDARFSKSCGGVSELFENCWAPVHYPYLEKVIDTVKQNELQPDLSQNANAEKWINSSPDVFCNTNDKNVLSQVLNNYDQETQDFFHWEVLYLQEELTEIIHRRSGIDFGAIFDLIPLKRGVSGRIIELKIVGEKQIYIVGKELEIRKWLSNSHLYSSAFVVKKSEIKNGIPQKFCLQGAGWGHGVGLCQIGAAVMGEKGYSYEEILLHYFKNAKLERIY